MKSDFEQPGESPDEHSGRFRTLQGPANWFTIQVPPGLQATQSEACLEIGPAKPEAASDSTSAQPEADNWSLTIYAAWNEGDHPSTDPTRFSPESLFPSLVRSTELEPLPIKSATCGWAGLSVKSIGPWWKKIFQRRNSYEWRLWLIEERNLMVVVSLQSATGFSISDDVSELIDQMLSSIEFAEHLALPPQLFRQQVVRLARERFPLLDIESTGSFGLRIEESEIRLTNFYRSYLHRPDQLDAIVLPGITTVVRLQEWGPDQLLPPLDTVADRIMPMLYPAEDAGSSLEAFARIPWVGGLTIMFVIDEDDTYRFVHSSMLKKWKTSLDDLQQLAMNNLDEYARAHPLEVSLIGTQDDPRMLVPLEQNAYNSVRLLGGDLHVRLRQILGPELVVGIPNRDFFVAVSLEHPRLISQIQQQVLQDFQSMHHPLTERLLVISADGVSEYCED
jgi:hypothetical protein